MEEEEKKRGGERVPQMRSKRSKSKIHLSTILVPLSPGPYGISRSVGSNGGERAEHGEEEGRGQERKEGKAKVRAGRRKRPRQDVGSCLPAGGWYTSVLRAYETCIRGPSVVAAAVRERKYRNFDPIPQFSRHCFLSLISIRFKFRLDFLLEINIGKCWASLLFLFWNLFLSQFFIFHDTFKTFLISILYLRPRV